MKYNCLRWEYQNIALVYWKDISCEVFRIISGIFKLSNEDTTRKHLYWKCVQTEVNILAQETAIWHDGYFRVKGTEKQNAQERTPPAPDYETFI